MAKLDIDIVLIDDSVVMHGFRALMSGATLDGFINNPIMLLQHNRPKEYEGKDDIMLPIGKWCDIRVEGNKLVARPEFDDDDELAMRVQKKVEKGYLNGASVWIEPFKISEEPSDMLPGQSLPTLTKWGLLEASIVDIPNCRNALAIRTSAGKRILLSGNQPTDEVKEYLKSFSIKNTIMENKVLASKLGLDEHVAESLLNQKLDERLGDHIKLAAANTKIEALTTENTALKQAAVEGKVIALVDGAIAGKKLMAGDREKYVKLAKADFDTTKELIEGMKPYESIESKLSVATTDEEKSELAELMKLSGVELYQQGKLEKLQKLSLPVFKTKYKEAFAIDYVEPKA